LAFACPTWLRAEASTPDDLAAAHWTARPRIRIGWKIRRPPLRAAITTQKLQFEAEEKGVFAAQTLNEIFRYRALHDAERVHLDITEDAEAGEKNLTLTFAELYAAGQRCAEHLARIGVPPGGRVSLMLPTSRAFFVSYAGILLAGAVPVPIYPPFRADRNRRIRWPSIRDPE